LPANNRGRGSQCVRSYLYRTFRLGNFGVEGCAISPQEALDAAVLTRFLVRLIELREALTVTIAAALPEVTALAKRNFELAT
jgi:hypothetical protein